MSPALGELARLFGRLSLLSFGGGNATVAAMAREAVGARHWVTGREFLQLFALSRVAPGPGSLIAALIGQRAAGLAGAIVATVAMLGPSSLVVFALARLRRLGSGGTATARWERALAPLAVGLTVGSGIVVGRQDEHGAVLATVTAAAFALLCVRRVPPLLVLALSGVAGWWAL